MDRILNTQVLPHIELDVVEMEECRVLARKLQGRGVHRLPMVGMGKCRQQCWVYQTTPTSQSVLQQCIHAAINRKKGVYLCYVLWQMVCTVSPNPKHTQFGFSTKHSPGLCRYKTIGENLGLLVTQMVHDLAQSNEVDIQIHVNCVDEMLKTREKKQVAKQTQPSASFGAVEVPVASGMWRAELKMPILKRVLPLTSTTTSTATGMSNDGVCANPDTFSCMEIESAKEVHNQSIIDLVKVHLKKMSSGINSRLKMAMCTGNWVGKRRQNCTRNGITQVLNESSPQWELSANSKVRHSEKKTGHKSSPPRQVQAEGAGGRCPHETVEGEKCGLVLHLSTGREITNSTDPRLIQMVLLQFMTTDSRISLLTVQQWMSCLYSPPNANAVLVARGSNSVSSSSGSNNTNNIPLDTQTLVRVEINGNLWRWTPTPLLFVRRFQKLRRLGHLDRHASVAYTPHLQLVEIDVRMGRVSAPLFIVSRLCDFIQAAQKQSQNRRWFRQENLMRLGFMDYVDLCERISESVAIDLTDLGRRPWCQYVEVDPSFLASPNVNLLLYRNSAKSARTVLSPIMSRQGIPYKEPWSKIRNANASMVYSFKPLAQSMMGRARPNCQRNGVTLNCGIIMAGVGQTVEDNCTLAQSVVDNWLLHTIHMSTELSIQKRFGSSLRRERFEKPDPETNTLKDACYDKIDKHGLIEPRTPIKTGDVVIGKTGPMGVAVTRKGSMLQDFSSVYKGSDGWVNRVHHLRNKDNLETVRVETACIRKPQVGDKLCSLHGQKVTIGAILPDHEMPFNEHGSLQIIYGSSCLRRKTSQPFEQYLTKAAVLDGKFIDATAFKSQEAWDACIKWAGDVLVKHGRRRDGCEWLTNGATGVRFKNPIFTGPLFVHRLVHMVDKKVHSRNRGPLGPDMQATAGRSSNGGSRIGFMERDTFIAYGCSETIQRLFQLSDQQTQYVCQSCGLFVPPTTRWQRKKKKSCATTAGRGAWGGDGGQDKNKTNELEQVVVFNCTVCGSEEPPHEVKLPYAMVNLNHMIMSVGICPHFITKKKTQSAIDRDQMMPVIY